MAKYEVLFGNLRGGTGRV